MKMNIGEVAKAIKAKLVQGDHGVYVYSVSTDSRQIEKGQLFFALRGSRYDAHDFVFQAVNAGASGVVVSRAVDGLPLNIPVLQVSDTLVALQKLAAYNRNKFTVPVIAITGSAGKTTTKEMVAAVLSVKFNVLKTPGNLNNEIGLPLTLLKIGEKHQVVVVEMAMRGPGEIDYLCKIARPTAGIITNIGDAHIERLGSIENIARAKGELLEHIPEDGFAFLNAHSPYIYNIALRCRGRVLFFGTKNNANIRAVNILSKGLSLSFIVEISGLTKKMIVPLPGVHNVYNALASIGIGWELGLSLSEIDQGLKHVMASNMRLEIKELKGIKVINDTYNANPSSMRAALNVLCEVAGKKRKIAVLGDMLELGGMTVSAHHQIGQLVSMLGINYLITVGDLARDIAFSALSHGFSGKCIFKCTSNKEAVTVLSKILSPGDVVLVKGSRAMHMEEIIEDLT